MIRLAESPAPTWPMTRLRRHFGNIPAERILLRPRPGCATEEDAVFMDDHEDRHCELVDGCLIEKAIGNFESLLAAVVISRLQAFVEEHDLGIVLAPDALIRLMPGLVRAPDVWFLSWETLGTDEFPDQAVGDVAPDLAIEIISRSNTRKEMERKIGEYFDHGVREVWLIYPKKKSVDVYRAPDKKKTVTGIVSGGKILPGFELPLAELFSSGRRRHMQ